MKKWKQTAALCVAAILAVSSLSGCSSTPASANTTGTTAEATTGAASNRLEAIIQRGYIEVATEPYFAPNEFIDPSKKGDDKYVGADIELARYIADKLGVECRIVPLDFTAVLSSITEGKYDLAISALAYTPARAEAMNMSNGYYFDSEESEYGLMVRTEDLDKIKNADDLADQVVVAQSGSLQELFVNEQIPAYKEFKRVSATTDGFLMVQEKKADAVVTYLSTAELYIEANKNCGMSIVDDFRFVVDESTQGTRIGIPKGETELTDKINEIIDEVVESGQMDQWMKEYTEYAASLGL